MMSPVTIVNERLIKELTTAESDSFEFLSEVSSAPVQTSGNFTVEGTLSSSFIMVTFHFRYYD
jgi:hypothetical protein